MNLMEEQITNISERIRKFIQFCKEVMEKIIEKVNEFLDYIKNAKVNYYKRIKKGKRTVLKISTKPLYKYLLRTRTRK